MALFLVEPALRVHYMGFISQVEEEGFTVSNKVEYCDFVVVSDPKIPATSFFLEVYIIVLQYTAVYDSELQAITT